MSLKFNGSDQGVLIPQSALGKNVSQITLMAWVYFEALCPDTGGILQIGISTLGGTSRVDIVQENDGTITLGARAPDSASRQSIRTSSAVSLNTLYHIAGTINFTTDTAKLYLNGVLATTTGSMAFTPTSTDNTYSAATSIGSNENNSGEFIDATVEDPRVYHRELSASEILTIVSCRGTDGIYQDLQARWFLIGAENATVSSSLDTISVLNPQGALSSVLNNTSITLSYTVPSGNGLNLIVVASAESDTSSYCQPSSATFGSVNMTKITSLQVGPGSYDGIGIFRVGVTQGDTGTITVNWAGGSKNRTIHALCLSNCQHVQERYETVTNDTGNTTDSILTTSSGAMVISAGINGNSSVLSVVGTNHVLDNAQTPDTSASAIGHVSVPSPTTITGIGFTSSSTNRMAQILVSFAPTYGGPVIDLSDNKYDGNAKNLPIYQGSFIKVR